MTQIEKTTLLQRNTKNMKLANIVRSLPIVPTLAAIYSVGGLVIDSIPFPGNALIGSPQIKNERIQEYRPSGSNSDNNLPTLNRDLDKATDKQSNFALQLAGSDGVIDKNERNTACTAAATNQAQVDAINEVILKVRDRKIRNVRLSSNRLNGCSQGVE